MAKKRGIKGKSVRTPAAEWEPLLDLAPAHVPDFMWMGSVELRDGTRLQLYKHYWTRAYLHLDGEGRAFVHTEPQRYEEIEPAWLLARALWVDPLVAEAEQGYDGPAAEFVSRPPDEEIEALRRIVFRVPVDVRDAAQQRADAEKRSLGELAAAALREYLGRDAVREKSGGS